MSFLNLLIVWIDAYARMNRRRNKAPGWRWRLLCGFVDRQRRLQRVNFLRDVSRLAKSIAVYFSNPQFDHPLFVLWQHWYHSYLCRESSSSDSPAIECTAEAVRVFDTLKRVAKDGKVRRGDYTTLKEYVSKQFRPPVSIHSLLDDRERKSFDEFVARAAASDVYLQYRSVMDGMAFDQDYVQDVTMWLMKLGEPEAQPQFEAIRRRFCGYAPGYFERQPKKTVGRSGARKLR